MLTTAGYLISADSVRQQVIGEIRAVTGLNPVLRGKASVSLFPTGSVSFADVTLGDAQQPALVAERLTARLRFFPFSSDAWKSPTFPSTTRGYRSSCRKMVAPIGPG